MMAVRLTIVLGVVATIAACAAEERPATAPPADGPALSALADGFAGRPAEELLDDAEARALGARLFDTHCAACHGSGDDPARGVPSLTQGGFSYGADAAAIRQTIVAGRHSTMPALGGNLGEVDIGQLVAYVQSFAKSEPLNEFEARGEKLYTEHCVACHSEDGSGKPELGAPDLRDDHWQHGNSMMNIRLAITRGTESMCPARGNELTAPEIELLTAHVLHLAAGPAH